MAHKKALVDATQKNCEVEAVDFVVRWYRTHKLKINKNDIFVVWFAYTKRGYRCMLTSHKNPNLFFEISANKKTKDIQCDCYERFEHLAINGSNYEVTNLVDRPLRYGNLSSSHKLLSLV